MLAIMESHESPKSRVQEVRLARAMKPADVARLAGMQPPTYGKIDLGQRGLTKTFSARIAKALDIAEVSLFDNIGSEIPGIIRTPHHQQLPPSNVRHALDAPAFPSMPALPRDVPVYGTAQGGPEGVFEINMMGEPIDYVRRLPGLMGVQHIFALYVEGNSMYPWRKPGSFVYVHQKRPASNGDYVVVVVRQLDVGEPPRAYLKQLVRRTADTVILEQFNPPKTITLQRNEIANIYRVIDWDEAAGL